MPRTCAASRGGRSLSFGIFVASLREYYLRFSANVSYDEATQLAMDAYDQEAYALPHGTICAQSVGR